MVRELVTPLMLAIRHSVWVYGHNMFGSFLIPLTVEWGRCNTVPTLFYSAPKRASRYSRCLFTSSSESSRNAHIIRTIRLRSALDRIFVLSRIRFFIRVIFGVGVTGRSLPSERRTYRPNASLATLSHTVKPGNTCAMQILTGAILSVFLDRFTVTLREFLSCICGHVQLLYQYLRLLAEPIHGQIGPNRTYFTASR